MPSFATLLAASALVPASAGFMLKMPIGRDGTYNYVHVGVGSPSVQHRLHFDTGSSTSWIISSLCNYGNCPNYTADKRPFVTYNASASMTAHDTGVYGGMDYLGGSVEGEAYKDKWDVGNDSWTQSFISAYQSSWAQIPADGFLGLAFSTISEANTTTVAETMLWEGLLDQPRIGILLQNTLNNTVPVGDGGMLTIGGSLEDTYSTGLSKAIPVVKEWGDNKEQYELWRARILAVTGHRKVNGTVSKTTVPGGTNVGKPSTASAKMNTKTISLPSTAYTVFDTGAEDFGVPSDIIDELYEAIGMNYTAIIKDHYIPKCADFNSDWAVTFTWGNDMASAVNITLTGDKFILPGFANREDACWPPFDDSGATSNFFIFGNRYLRNVYTVLDFGSNKASTYKPTIKFGDLKDEYKTDLTKSY